AIAAAEEALDETAEASAEEAGPQEEIGGKETELADQPMAEGEAIVEEEGPEPARIPTSLTATLREQGQRQHLHRISRRTRRRGRGDRGDRPDRGPAPEGQRPPQTEGRPPQTGGRPPQAEGRPERPPRPEG